MHIQTSIHIHARFQNQNAWHGTPNVYKWKICTQQSRPFCLSHVKYSREYLLSLIEQWKIKFLFASMYTTDVYSKSQNLDLLSLTVNLLGRGSKLQEHRSFLFKSLCHYKTPSICIIASTR